MHKNTIRLGLIFGIPLELDLSWFLIFILFTWTFAEFYYPNEFDGWTGVQYWALGALTAFLLFGSVLLHELGHSWTARRYRLPVRSITLFIFGGAARISAEPVSAWSEFWIALSGPLVNLALAGLFALLRMAAGSLLPLLALFTCLMYVNLIVGAFNLLPGFPLDGGGVLMALVWGVTRNHHRAMLFASIAGTVFAYVFIVYGVYEAVYVHVINGIWISFIGWFLMVAARSQLQHERLRDILAGHKAGEAMSAGYALVDSDATLQQLVDERLLEGRRRSLVVIRDGLVAGMLTPRRLKSIPRSLRASTTAAETMIPAAELKQVSPDTGLVDALDQMDREGINQLPVIEAGCIQGMLTREDVTRFMRTLPPTTRA